MRRSIWASQQFPTPTAPWFLLATYGLYQAFTEGVTKAMVSDVVAPDQRAGAIGLFYTVSGFGQLAASIVAGFTWDIHLLHGRVMFPFAFGAACAIAGAAVLFSFRFKPTHSGFPVIVE